MPHATYEPSALRNTSLTCNTTALLKLKPTEHNSRELMHLKTSYANQQNSCSLEHTSVPRTPDVCIGILSDEKKLEFKFIAAMLLNFE